MVFSRKRPSSPESLPIVIDEAYKQNNGPAVLDTLNDLQIPPERCIVFGSGVLALLGLPRRASDVDALLHPDFHKEVMANGQLPNGASITIPRADTEIGITKRDIMGHFTTPASDPSLLPAEFFLRFGSAANPTSAFEDLFDAGVRTEGSYRVMAPRTASEIKQSLAKRNLPSGDPVKQALNAYDAGLYDEYLRAEMAQRKARLDNLLRS